MGTRVPSVGLSLLMFWHLDLCILLKVIDVIILFLGETELWIIPREFDLFGPFRFPLSVLVCRVFFPTQTQRPFGVAAGFDGPGCRLRGLIASLSAGP